MADTKANGIGYQKFRGNPENKLFYLIDNFIGGINTEFTDDSSSPADFARIINFDMDKLGVLHKRQGFGKISALSDLFGLISPALVPVVKNRTENNTNPEENNDNVVYMGLLRNDNNCFRNLAGFSGINAFREYQKRYGFQNNTFILLILTTSLTNGAPSISNSWYYKCTLPEFTIKAHRNLDETYQRGTTYCNITQTTDNTYQADKIYLGYNTTDSVYVELIEGVDYGIGETIETTVYDYTELIEGEDYKIGDTITAEYMYSLMETVEIEAYKAELPVIFDWDRNLLNMENIEYYDKIYFTHNNKGLVCFDRTASITSNTTLLNAFSYAGFNASGITNLAFKPSAYEVTNFGYNMLAGSNPIYYVGDSSVSSDSIQGMALFDKNFKPTYDTIPSGQNFKVGIYYTGTHNNFTLTFKSLATGNNYNSSDIIVTVDNTNSTNGFRVYDITVKTNLSGEVELKAEMQSSNISPQYDYYTVGEIDADTPEVTSGINVGKCGIVFMNERALYYNKDTVWFSQLNDFTYVPSNNYLTFPLVATDEITKICYFKKSYIVFTKYQIWKITGGQSLTGADFSKEIVNESIGCHAGNTVVPIDNTLYFASPRGLYSLKSNQFVEGYENVGELDTKVKTLTSDYTLYAEDREQPAIRYNGISKYAYAFRYKDKYMLFYNNYDDKGDYAAQNNLDALIYQYEIGSYTTYRFEEKPTFLFLNDNAIETIATVKEKEELTDEQVLFDYNFTANLNNSGKVIDNSGNGYDAPLIGNAVVNKSVGLKFNGTNACGTFSDFNGNIKNGFELQIDTKCFALNGSYLIDIQQESTSINAQTFSNSFVTGTSYGYKARVDYTITPNPNTKKDTVSYKVYLLGDSVPKTSGSFKYKIAGPNGSVLVGYRTVSFNISNGTQLVDSGTFTITRNSDGSYHGRWDLVSTVYYSITTSGINKGSTTYYDEMYYSVKTNRGNTFNWLQAGFYRFKAEPTDTGCKITYTPAIKLTSGWYPGNPYIEVTINGETYRHDFGSWSGGSGTSSNPYIKTADQKVIYLNYTGSKTVSVSVHLHGTFTRSSDGLYYTDYYVNDLSYSCPSIEPYSNTINYERLLTGYIDNSFDSYGTASYREIALKQSNGDQLVFFLTSEYGNFTLYTNQGIGLLERHTWKVVVTSTGNCSIYKDDNVIKTGTLNTNILINASRTVNSVGTDRARTAYYNGEIYSLSLFAGGNSIINYPFNDKSGNIARDISGYDRNMTLYNTQWLNLPGLSFEDANSYLSIPKIDYDIPFVNGFKITFEGIINAGNDIVRVIDLAKDYKSETSQNNFNSINVGFKNNMMAFNSTGSNGRIYRVEAYNIDTTVNHTYVINCSDNGNGYYITISIDGAEKANSFFTYGGIANVRRASNFVGKSNNSTETSQLLGNLLNLKVEIYGSTSGVPVYKSSIYEFDSTPTDFGQPIYIDVLTKGVNMNYPQHLKKLKHTFIKLIGGDEFSQLFFALYVDGHLVNDPRKYAYHIDDNGTVVLEYYEDENMDVNGTISILGNIIIDKTKLGESVYQTIKMVVPKKGKNFALRIYGNSEEFLTLDSFGLVCKLGKVKQG